LEEKIEARFQRASYGPILRCAGRSATRTLSKTGTLQARFNGSGGKFYAEANRARNKWRLVLILFGPGVAADPGKHNPAKMAFEKPVRPGQRLIEFGAFFEFASVQIRLAQHLLGGFAAFGAHCIKFENNSGRAANRQFHVLLSLSHANRIASEFLPRHVQKADSRISVCLTSPKAPFVAPTLDPFSAPSLRITMNRLRREGRQTDGDVFRAFRKGCAVLHPFACESDDALTSIHIERARFMCQAQHSSKHNRELVELWRLTGFNPATGAAHVSNTEASLGVVHTTNVFVDQLWFIPGSSNAGRFCN
jgi:hypothetical protein